MIHKILGGNFSGADEWEVIGDGGEQVKPKWVILGQGGWACPACVCELSPGLGERRGARGREGSWGLGRACRLERFPAPSAGRHTAASLPPPAGLQRPRVAEPSLDQRGPGMEEGQHRELQVRRVPAYQGTALEELNLLPFSGWGSGLDFRDFEAKPVHSPFCLSWIRSELLQAQALVW